METAEADGGGEGGFHRGCVSYRSAGRSLIPFHLKHLVGGAEEVVIGTASVMLILGAAAPFGWVLASERAPQSLALAFAPLKELRQLLLAISILLLILGCFMEAVSILIILAPVLMPIVASARHQRDPLRRGGGA